jgi:hypothetical protein
MYSQKDIRWRFLRLGSGRKNIGQAGCLLTCYAQLLTNYGIEINPGRLNQVFTMLRIYIDGNLLPDNALQRIYPDYAQYSGSYYPSRDLFPLLERKPGEEIILKIDANPSPGEQRHFVLLKSVLVDKYAKTTEVVIADPLGGWVGDFARRYGDPQENIVRIIKYRMREVK